MKNLNTVILCSGNGSIMEAIAKASISNELNLNIISIISHNPNAFALERAKNLGIRVDVLPKGIEPRDQELLNILIRDEVELILLVGYIKKLSAETVSKFKDKILNIHCSLLPKYGGQGMYGMRVHEAVCLAEEKETGSTVHIVTEEYDQGPIILQERLKVEPADTPQLIAEKIKQIEPALYIRAIKKYLESHAH